MGKKDRVPVEMLELTFKIPVIYYTMPAFPAASQHRALIVTMRNRNSLHLAQILCLVKILIQTINQHYQNFLYPKLYQRRRLVFLLPLLILTTVRQSQSQLLNKEKQKTHWRWRADRWGSCNFAPRSNITPRGANKTCLLVKI